MKQLIALLLIFFSAASTASSLTCNRGTLAGTYSASGVVVGSGSEVTFFTARVVLRAGGGLQIPVMRATVDGQRVKANNGRGGWTVPRDCVGTMKWSGAFDGPNDEPDFIDFTVAGSLEHPIFRGVISNSGSSGSAPISGNVVLERIASP